MSERVRIANISGFYGDRLSAAREMLDGPDPIDVVTGDYLAELTMLILWKARRKDPRSGTRRRSSVRWKRRWALVSTAAFASCRTPVG